MLVRSDEHVAALTTVVLGAFTDRGPCRRKDRRPLTPAALAEADRIRQAKAAVATTAKVVDFAAYAAAARPLGRDAAAGEHGGGR